MRKIFHQSKFSIIICFISILISGLYFFFISTYANDKIWDTATTFVSTLLSIIIGVTISITVYNYQKDQQDIERFNELKVNLTAELSDLNRVLNSGEAVTINQLPFIVASIHLLYLTNVLKVAYFLLWK